jgi:TetR/AcrR family transcriptional regulator, transcriptional repressor for nem operon
MATRQRRDTASAILDVAERLVQSRGFNGFSYADVAAQLHVTKPSLHYHFASKGELGAALMTRYRERFAQALAGIEAGEPDARARLRAYADLYAGVLDGQLMCLCGMLAAEFETLPAAMRDGVRAFFEESEEWVARVLEQGRGHGTLRFGGSARDHARAIVSGLEGAMLVARPYADPERFRSAAATLLASLGDERD